MLALISSWHVCNRRQVIYNCYFLFIFINFIKQLNIFYYSLHLFSILFISFFICSFHLLLFVHFVVWNLIFATSKFQLWATICFLVADTLKKMFILLCFYKHLDSKSKVWQTIDVILKTNFLPYLRRIFWNSRSSHRRCSVEKDVLRNFAKHLCQSLFF